MLCCLEEKGANFITVAGVLWASRMLDGAKALCLSRMSLEQVAEGAAHGLVSIKQVQPLIIDAPQYSYADRALSCLPWVLAQISELEVLLAPTGNTPWFPPMVTLKHLNLNIESSQGNLCAAVRDCICLETLSLVYQGTIIIGRLEMRDLSNLRVVVLKGLAPDSISVPEACQLQIALFYGIDRDMQNGNLWRRVLANINSIDAIMTHLDTVQLTIFLNATLKPLQNLQTLRIEMSGNTSIRNVLDLTGFAQIKKLCISGKELALRIPADVSWDTLEVIATEGLALGFEDVGAFTQAVHCFSASYKHLCSTGALELCRALTLRGIKCTFLDNGPDACCKFWFPAAVIPFGCCCGACLDCLIASGDIVADAGGAEFPCRPRSYI